MLYTKQRYYTKVPIQVLKGPSEQKENQQLIAIRLKMIKLKRKISNFIYIVSKCINFLTVKPQSFLIGVHCSRSPPSHDLAVSSPFDQSIRVVKSSQ